MATANIQRTDMVLCENMAVKIEILIWTENKIDTEKLDILLKNMFKFGYILEK